MKLAAHAPKVRAVSSLLTNGAYLKKGSQVAHNVLERITVAERDRVIVRSVAPCKFISPRKCLDVRSLVAEPTRDAVPHFDLLGRIRFSETVKVVKSHPSAPRMDHAFMSPTYKPHISDAIQEYFDIAGRVK